MNFHIKLLESKTLAYLRLNLINFFATLGLCNFAFNLLIRFKRRTILLLEVLIAFAIIVLWVFPLIYPHAAMARSQREFIKKIELDHAVTLLFAQVYQDLLTNKIEWNDIESKRRFEITPQDLQKLNRWSSLPFKGYYYFEPVIHKPKSQTPQETTAYILD